MPGSQVLLAHWSPVVQASPSSQAMLLAVLMQSPNASQPSSVHGLPSSQEAGAWPEQTPPWQVSPVVQELPSSQAPVLGVARQPVAGLQLSSVHWSPSSQPTGVLPPHWPALHDSPVVHALPSSQVAVSSLLITQPIAA